MKKKLINLKNELYNDVHKEVQDKIYPKKKDGTLKKKSYKLLTSFYPDRKGIPFPSLPFRISQAMQEINKQKVMGMREKDEEYYKQT